MKTIYERKSEEKERLGSSIFTLLAPSLLSTRWLPLIKESDDLRVLDQKRN